MNTIRDFLQLFLLWVILLGIKSPIYAQFRLGIVSSNYSGSQSVMINPSNIVNSKLYIDVNVMSVNFSAQNNYLYIPAKDYSLGSLISEIDRNIDYYNEYDHWMDREDMNYKEEPYTDGTYAKGFINGELMGPSSMYAFNDQAFSFYSSFRNYGTVYNFPFAHANFLYHGYDLESQLNTNYFNRDYGGIAASWLELGFSYARVLKKEYNKHLSAGVTLKRLFSYGASFLDFEKMNFRVEEDANFNILDSDFNFAYALPLDYATNTYEGGLNVYGKGWGFDLGMTYQIKERGFENNYNKRACEQEFEPYILKLGVSLLDIGKINYNRNGEVHHYEGSLVWNAFDTVQFLSVKQFSSELSRRYNGDSQASLTDTVFSIGLPTALSFQADYHYMGRFYIGGLIVFPLKVSKYQLRRPAMFAIIPRYESDLFEFSTPLSIYNFNELRMGLSVRYGFLSLGTDKLGALLGFNNFDGIDFYMMVKINFRKGRCGNRALEICNE